MKGPPETTLGSTIQMSLYVRSFPKPELNLIKNGQLIDNTNMLTINEESSELWSQQSIHMQRQK